MSAERLAVDSGVWPPSGGLIESMSGRPGLLPTRHSSTVVLTIWPAVDARHVCDQHERRLTLAQQHARQDEQQRPWQVDEREQRPDNHRRVVKSRGSLGAVRIVAEEPHAAKDEPDQREDGIGAHQPAQSTRVHKPQQTMALLLLEEPGERDCIRHENYAAYHEEGGLGLITQRWAGGPL